MSVAEGMPSDLASDSMPDPLGLGDMTLFFFFCLFVPSQHMEAPERTRPVPYCDRAFPCVPYASCVEGKEQAAAALLPVSRRWDLNMLIVSPLHDASALLPPLSPQTCRGPKRSSGRAVSPLLGLTSRASRRCTAACPSLPPLTISHL